MPVVVTFDLRGASSVDRNRIQCMFERFGWQGLGGSSYRYPRLGADQPVEDWFNHVIPALMLFRTYVVKRNHALTKFTLDANSSAGFDPSTAYGSLPTDGLGLVLYDPTRPSFGEQRLRDWVEGIDFPY